MFDYIAESVAAMIIFIALVSFSLGVLAMWGIPIVWHWLMPIIRAATA